MTQSTDQSRTCTDAPHVATLGGPDTITAAARSGVRVPGDRNQTPYDFDHNNQLIPRHGAR